MYQKSIVKNKLNKKPKLAAEIHSELKRMKNPIRLISYSQLYRILEFLEKKKEIQSIYDRRAHPFRKPLKRYFINKLKTTV